MKKTNRFFFKIIVLSLTWMFGRPSPIAAQEIKFKHLSIEDGLSQSTVLCMLQGQKGFMWFGTQDGLNCFDGYTFSVYRNDPDDSNSISGNYIQTLFEDHSGRLWVGTLRGLNLFDAKTKTFEAYKNDPKNPSSLSNNLVFSIKEDHSGQLWVGTYGGGLNLFDAKTKTFEAYKNDPKNPSSLSNNSVWSITEDHIGRLWVGTIGGGLNLFDAKTKTFEVYKNDPKNPLSLSNNSVRSITEDSSGRLWLGTGGGLSLFDAKTKTFEAYKNDSKNPSSLSNNSVWSITEDQSGRLWVGTDGGGLDFFDAKTKAFEVYKNDPKNPSTLSSNRVFSITEDQSGRLWVGTFDGGLNLFDAKTKTFEVYKNDPKNPSSLSSNRVFSIAEDHSGRLWVGTLGGGLNFFDAKTKTFEVYKNDPKNPSSLSNNSVLSIAEDQSGRLWVGTDGGGLNLYDAKTKTFECYKNDPMTPSSLSSNGVYSIAEDHSGRLWVGTDGGLNLFDAKTKTFEVYKNDPKNPSSLSNNNILSITEDHSGRLWVGTNGGGLNLYDAKTKTFKVFREKQGLPNDVVLGILEDSHGRLWLSTNRGLSRFTPPDSASPLGEEQAGMFRNYDVTDGLQSNEFNEGAFFKGRDGRMYFGGINGFNVFHPDSIKDDLYVPPIVLTKFELFNRRMDPGKEQNDFVLRESVTEADELILSYKESVFTLEFSALSFALAEKNKYAYKLEGFDKDWNYTDAKRRFATYTNLDPKTYTFRVKGSNHDGIWNEEGRTLKIIITPPWWKTWWFQTLLALTLIGGAFMIYTVRIRSIELEKIKLETLVEQRTQELQNQTHRLEGTLEQLSGAQVQLVQSEKMASLGKMVAGIAHEINNPISFVYGNLEYIKNLLSTHDFSSDAAAQGDLKQDVMEATLSSLTGAKRISEIVQNLRAFSKLDQIEFVETDVNKDLDTVLDLFISQNSDITIRKHFADDVRLLCYVRQLNQCYLNILINAVQSIRDAESTNALEKGSGLITITTEKRSDDIQIKISDNGVGISKENSTKIFDPFFTTRFIGQGKGLGLSESYGIIQRHNGKIEVVSEESKGAEFILTIPLRRE